VATSQWHGFKIVPENSAILILEPYAFEVKKVIGFISVISMGYASRNSIENHN